MTVRREVRRILRPDSSLAHTQFRLHNWLDGIFALCPVLDLTFPIPLRDSHSRAVSCKCPRLTLSAIEFPAASFPKTSSLSRTLAHYFDVFTPRECSKSYLLSHGRTQREGVNANVRMWDGRQEYTRLVHTADEETTGQILCYNTDAPNAEVKQGERR
jgi:hypothetical protein